MNKLDEILQEGEQPILAGPPVSRSSQRKIGIDRYIPPNGAVKEHCDLCGAHFWLGPNQKETKKQTPGIPCACFNCVAKYAEKNQRVANCGGAGGSYSAFGKDYSANPGTTN